MAASRTFTVTTRGSERVVVSTLTDREAADLCQTIPGDFPQDLARSFVRGKLSYKQRAWMHVLAVEEDTARKAEADLRGKPMGFAAARAEEQEEREAIAQEPQAEEEIPFDEPAPVAPQGPAACDTRTMGLKKGMLSCEASDFREVFPVGRFPQIVRVRSHRTGEVKEFQRTGLSCDAEGEIQAANYAWGTTSLVVFND